MRYAVIMAGGAGTRLWPMSRVSHPKQLLPFIRRGGTDRPTSLLELAVQRLDVLIEPRHRYICTSESYRAAIRQRLPEIGDDLILGEPMGRDTVNAVGLSAAVLAKRDPNAVFAVLTADHIIEPIPTFQRLMDVGFRLVEQDASRLVTFSIRPTYAATGYGYVERGAAIPGVPDAEGLVYRVARFVEKPDLPRAQAYVLSGVFGWNSGMFVWKASTFLDCLRRFKPECHDGLMRIQEAWGTPRQRKVLDEVYPTLPKTSVDYAIMEPASRASGPAAGGGVSVCTVLMDISWLDVGSWPSYAQTLPADASGNRCADVTPDGSGRCILEAASGSLVVNADPGHTVAVLGATNLAVIHTPDATLVMPLDKAEALKTIHAKVDPRLL